MDLSEDTRRKLVKAGAYVCWFAALGLTTLRVFGVGNVSLGIVIVLMMGIGVVFSLTLSRMTLQRVITQVFVTGLRTATSLHGGTENRLRELHHPIAKDGLPVEVCAEDGKLWPCPTKEVLDREDGHR